MTGQNLDMLLVASLTAGFPSHTELIASWTRTFLPIIIAIHDWGPTLIHALQILPAVWVRRSLGQGTGYDVALEPRNIAFDSELPGEYCWFCGRVSTQGQSSGSSEKVLISMKDHAMWAVLR